MPKTQTTRYDVAEHLRTPEEMAAYFEACLEEANGDAAFIAKALGTIARAKGMSQVARDAGLSGSPVIEVAIRSDGRLQESRVQRSSGHAALDQAALNILRLASPFDPFPPELAANYRMLRFAYQWEFVAGRPTSGSVTAGTDAPNAP